MPIRGEKLLQFRIQMLGLSRPELATKLGKSAESIRRYEKPGVNLVPIKFIRQLAEVSGRGAAIMQLHLVPKEGDELTDEQMAILREQGSVQGNAFNMDASEVPPAIHGNERSNIEAFSRTRYFEIPIFNLAVSAGHWCDVDGAGETVDPRSIEQALFRIHLSGDSMEPLFDDGSTVEFRRLNAATATLVVGRHYYVQKSDETATFKTLVKTEEERLVLSAINKKKYPKPMIVERGLIVSMAEAVAKVTIL